jgi:hypothetical protein
MSADETPVTWRRSSFSQGGDCVEIAHISTQVFVRDSKNPHGNMLTFTLAEWSAFIEDVKTGDANRTCTGD